MFTLADQKKLVFGEFEFLNSSARTVDPMDAMFDDVALEVRAHFDCPIEEKIQIILV